MTSERFVLHDGDRFFYFIGAFVDSRTVVTGDGVPMVPAAVRGWYAASREVAQIRVRQSDRTTCVAYELPEDVTVGGLSRRLSLAQWAELGEDSEARQALYEPVYESVPGEVVDVEGPWTLLEGSPRAIPTNWEARLPFALRHAEEYRHLFPGRLGGFRRALKEALDALPDVDAYDNGNRGFSVYVHRRFDQPLVRRYRAFGDRKVKDHETREHTVPVDLGLVPDVTEGADLAAAEEAWAAQIASYVERVKAESEMRTCSACEGRGVLFGPEASR